MTSRAKFCSVANQWTSLSRFRQQQVRQHTDRALLPPLRYNECHGQRAGSAVSDRTNDVRLWVEALAPYESTRPLKTKHTSILWQGTVTLLMAMGVAFTLWSYGQIEGASTHRRDFRAVIGATDDLLYVEDNRANMESAAQLIGRRLDMRMLHAEDGPRCNVLARAQQPDVILTDINLPGVSGLQALGLLHEDPLTRHVPGLAWSANAMPCEIEWGTQADFHRDLTQPIRISEFMPALDGQPVAGTFRLGAMAMI